MDLKNAFLKENLENPFEIGIPKRAQKIASNSWTHTYILNCIFLQVVGTVIGPLKKHIGRDVLVSELDVGDPVPIHSQVEMELQGILYQFY